MNITTVRDSLLEILQKSSYFTSNKITDLKIFKAVLITATQNSIKINTTNVADYFSGEIGGKVFKTGAVLVDLKTLIEIVKNLSDSKITLEKKDSHLIISSASGKIKLVCLDKDSFPEPEKIEVTKELPKEVFNDSLIRSVLFSCATDEARPILTGLCFDFREEWVNLVGTDGFRLSLQKIDKSVKEVINQKIVFSSKGLLSVFKVFKGDHFLTSLSKDFSRVIFVSGEITIISKTLEGEFPPYDKVIPQQFETSAVLKTKEFLEIVRASSLFAREGSGMLNLSINHKEMVISSAGVGIGEALFKIPINGFVGKENKIVFNYRYLLEYLNNSQEEDLIFEMSTAFAPGVFKGKKNPGFLHIIMPIRSQE